MSASSAESSAASPVASAAATSADRLLDTALAANRSVLSEIEAKELLAALGIPTTAARAAQSGAEAVKLAGDIGYPVVLKVISPAITHKSDLGGVKLNLQSAAEVERAFGEIEQALRSAMPEARFDGVAVQAMARAGIEMFAGITRDRSYGPMVVAGLGGVWVEVLKDVAMRPAPLSEGEARAMLEELRCAPLLAGVRGAPAADSQALARLLVALGELAARRREIAEIDLNPVLVYADGLLAVDARVLLSAPRPPESAEQVARGTARRENLKRALAAQTVVVIGDKKANNYLWLRAQKNFQGRVYSVQIDPAEIPNIEALGFVNFKSLAEVPEPIDHAITAVPRQVAPLILKECIARGVKGVQFFTSGFSETGDETGLKLERQILELANASDVAIIGPNCMGLYNGATGLCNFPDQPVSPGGNACFISQSGTHMVQFANQAPLRGIKPHKGASIGNSLVLEAPDFLEVMAEDPATAVIGMYVEGVREGERFRAALGRAASRVPVVIWKGGLTAAGARATFSHTASLATSAAVWEAVLRGAGAVGVGSWDALMDALAMFSLSRPIRGRRMGLVAMTGGQSVYISDSFAGAGMEIPALSPDSYDELKSFFNVIGGSYRNPMDAGGTIGGPQAGNLDRILEILERDPVIDAIALEIATGLNGHRWSRHEDELLQLLDQLNEFAQHSRKPFSLIMHRAHLEPIVARAKLLAVERGLLVFESFERAARTLSLGAAYWAMHSA